MPPFKRRKHRTSAEQAAFRREARLGPTDAMARVLGGLATQELAEQQHAVAELLAHFTLAPRRSASDPVRFIPIQTFYDGTVYIGADDSASASNIVYPNRGMVIMQSEAAGNICTLYAVEKGKDARGKTRSMLTTTVLRNMLSDSPSVSRTQLPVDPTRYIGLHIGAGRGDFVKVAARGVGQMASSPNETIERFITSEAGNLTAGQQLEFRLLAQAVETAWNPARPIVSPE